jgi:hypothetical protein
MNKLDLINAAKLIIDKPSSPKGQLVEAIEFFRVYAGEKSSFYKGLSHYANYSVLKPLKEVEDYLLAFIHYVENGLQGNLSIQRQAQLEVTSDFLAQADVLLSQNNVHPAAPTVLIGATLEEFLRNWVEDDPELSIGDKKPGIDVYASKLRENELITKQDMKDITAWSGLRNDAAHGIWENVNEKNKVSLMLQGVNLFIRKYTT